jgi:CHAD domain-containing protein
LRFNFNALPTARAKFLRLNESANYLKKFLLVASHLADVPRSNAHDVMKARKIPGINYDAPAAEGMERVLLVRLSEMCDVGGRVLECDPEGVHDMRVASRRLRGALRDFLPHMNSRPLLQSWAHLRKLARALGKVRDYDVTIALLMKTADKAPAEFADGIRRIAGFREAGLEEYRLKLMSWARADSLDSLQQRFVTALKTALKPKKQKRTGAETSAGPTYRQVATDATLKRLEQFEELTGSLYRPLKVKPLHNLRIATKHLRYALELFDGCWSASTAPMAKQLAAMQTALGDLHDCDVLVEDFGAAATEEITGLKFDYKATSVWLMTHFLEERGKHLKKALDHWNKWEKGKMSQYVRELVEPQSAS